MGAETILGLSHPTLDKWSSFDSGVTKGQFIVSVNYCQLTRELEMKVLHPKVRNHGKGPSFQALQMNHVTIVTKALLLIETVILGQVDYLCRPGQALNIFTPTHDSMINTSSHSSH